MTVRILDPKMVRRAIMRMLTSYARAVERCDIDRSDRVLGAMLRARAALCHLEGTAWPGFRRDRSTLH